MFHNTNGVSHIFEILFLLLRMHASIYDCIITFRFLTVCFVILTIVLDLLALALLQMFIHR